MPKNATDELFLLIKSLSKAEKSYFKKNALARNPGKRPIYMELFDALDKQQEYDEHKIIKRIKGIVPSRFSDQKNFLYNLLLRYLEQFHESNHAQLLSKLHRVEILYEKGLYKQCAKLLAKAAQLALKSENYLMTLQIIHWEKRIHIAGFNTTYLKQSGKTLEREKQLLDQYLNICEYEQIDSEITLMVRRAKSTLRLKKMKEFEGVVKNRLLSSESKALSVNAKIAYHRIYSLYYYSRGLMDKYEQECETVIKLLESKPGLTNEMPGFYARSVYNLLVAQVKKGNTSEMNANLVKIKRLPAQLDEVKLWQFTAINFELSVLFTRREFDKVMELVAEAETKFRLLRDKINYDVAAVFNYQLARIFVLNAQYSRALSYLNRILNASKMETEFAEDIYCFSHLLRIIIHFELGNINIIGHLVKSAQRFLQKRRELYQFEKHILNFFLKTVYANKKRGDLTLAFTELKTRLEGILESPLESKAKDYFDFLEWIESKIEKRSFLEVMKETKRDI